MPHLISDANTYAHTLLRKPTRWQPTLMQAQALLLKINHTDASANLTNEIDLLNQQRHRLCLKQYSSNTKATPMEKAQEQKLNRILFLINNIACEDTVSMQQTTPTPSHAIRERRPSTTKCHLLDVNASDLKQHKEMLLKFERRKARTSNSARNLFPVRPALMDKVRKAAAASALRAANNHPNHKQTRPVGTFSL